MSEITIEITDDVEETTADFAVPAFFLKRDEMSKAVGDLVETANEVTHEQIVEAAEYVIEIMTADALTDQLIEEMAELTQALMKKRRAEAGTTPVTLKKACEMIHEELSDVMMCIEALGYEYTDPANNPKWIRWAKRLEYDN